MKTSLVSVRAAHQPAAEPMARNHLFHDQMPPNKALHPTIGRGRPLAGERQTVGRTSRTKMAAKVSLSQVVEALELASNEMSWFVHKQTGQVVMVSHEVMRLAEADAEADLPAWQEEELRVARDVLESTDWLGLPSKFDVHEWEIMNRFGQSVAVPAQREEVLDAIHGSGAFRQFKSTIRRLRLEDAWFSYRDSAFEDMAKSWLDEHGFEIDDDVQLGGRPTGR